MKTLLVSACLLGVRCKYSGGDNLCPQVATLRERFQLIPVCPEQLGGLSTPRPPAERQGDQVVTKEGRDVTAEYRKGAEEALKLARLFDCQAAVLKVRSPSCGCGEIYDGTFSGTRVPGDGVTAALLRENGLKLWTEDDLDKIAEVCDFDGKPLD